MPREGEGQGCRGREEESSIRKEGPTTGGEENSRGGRSAGGRRA